MQDIRRVVLEHLESSPITNPAGQHAEDTGAITPRGNGSTESREFKAAFDVMWDVLDFIKNQFGEIRNTPIGSVIALSGSAMCAQATTVQEYMEQHWPNTGAILLDSLNLLLVNCKYVLSNGMSILCVFVSRKDYKTLAIRTVLYYFNSVAVC